MPQKTFRATPEHLALVERAATKMGYSVDAYLRHVVLPHAARILDEPKPDLSIYPESRPKDPVADAAKAVGLSPAKVNAVLALLQQQLAGQAPATPEPPSSSRPTKRRRKR